MRKETRDSLADLSFPVPLLDLCSHEKTTDIRMPERQYRAFIRRIISVAATKRIGSYPWVDSEPRQDTTLQGGMEIRYAHNDPRLSTARPEANHDAMKENISGFSYTRERPPVLPCLAIVPYRHHSERVPDNTAIQQPQVSRQDLEAMLFAIQLAITANAQNHSNRKRDFDYIRSNQNEGNMRHPFRKMPKQLGEGESLFETSLNKRISFQCPGEQLVTSRSTEEEPLNEPFASDEKFSDVSVHEFNHIDVESKAQRRKRKEEKRKRRDQKLAKIREKKQQRMERHASNQVHSKRAREDFNCDRSREKVSLLVSENSEIQCDNLKVEDHDLGLDDAGGKRQKTEASAACLNVFQPGENTQQNSQSPLRKRSLMHNNVAQRPRLPFGVKISTAFALPGSAGVAWKKRATPSSNTVDLRCRATQSQPTVLKQTIVREQPIEDKALKTSFSARPLAHGLTKYQTSCRSEIRPNCLSNNEVGSEYSKQGGPPNSRAIDVAYDQASVQENFIGVNEESARDPIQVLCTESFLETWSDLVCAITSSQWPQPNSSVPKALRFVDSPLLEGCGVDLELSQRGALLLICTSVLDEEAAARDIVVGLAELVAANRYIYIYVLLIHDMVTTPNISLCICRLQNAVLQHARQPPTRVIFKSSTTASLSESLANIIVSREMSSAANSKLSIENYLENTQFCQQACFLRRLVPSLSGNGAIQCLILARALTSPAESSFSTILTSKAMREQIMLAATSSPSRAPEINPECMNQLSVLVSAKIGP